MSTRRSAALAAAAAEAGETSASPSKEVDMSHISPVKLFGGSANETIVADQADNEEGGPSNGNSNGTNQANNAFEPEHEEDQTEEEEKVNTKSNGDATLTEEEQEDTTQDESAMKTPKSKGGRPRRTTAVTPSTPKAPPADPRKRGALTDPSAGNKAKRRRGGGSVGGGGETSAPLKVEDMELEPSKVKAEEAKAKEEEAEPEKDPYDYSSSSERQPASLKVQIEKGKHGAMAFKRTPKLPGLKGLDNTSDTPGSSHNTLTQLSLSQSSHQLKTPKTANRTPAGRGRARKKAAKAESESHDEEKMEVDNDEDEHSPVANPTPKTPKRGRKSAVETKTPKKPEQTPVTNVVPELSAQEQLEVDITNTKEHLIAAGARVFARYGDVHYPAIVCSGSDGVRYDVYFVEDSLRKNVPRNAVILLSAIKEGFQTWVTPQEEDKNSVGYKVVVLSTPDISDAEKWAEGLFEVESVDSKEKRTVSWEQFYLRKEDAQKVLSPTDHSLLGVDKANVVSEDRSARRSRAKFDVAEKSTPVNTKQRRSTVAKPTEKSASDKSMKEEELDKTQEASVLETPKKEEIPEEEEEQHEETDTTEVEAQETGKVTPTASQMGEPPSTSRRSSRVKPNASITSDETEIAPPPGDGTPPSAVTSAKKRRGRPPRKTDGSSAESVATDSANESPVKSPAKGKTLKSPVTEKSPKGGKKASGPKQIFANMKFVLTSATRNRQGQLPFNKRECRQQIEDRGGIVIEDFKNLGENDDAYLIADTHYRTHKYISALSLSVPCVHHSWIKDCCDKDEFIDRQKYMLSAGKAPDDEGILQEYEWKPLKGTVMKGKTVWIHSKSRTEAPVLGFVPLWAPIIRNLGATVILDQDVPQNPIDLLNYLREDKVDAVLTDTTCEPEVCEAVDASERAFVIGSEWVIEALITGELPSSDNPRFKHNAS